MKLHFDDATEALRGELREWLAANRPTVEEMAAEPAHSSAHLPPWARIWQRRLFDAGWLVPGWPPERGGRNATPVQQLIYFEELARLALARSYNPQGLSIIAPSIQDYGSDLQRQRYVLPTLRAEITWCLGMSEPGAGSDLAGLSTRAERDGDRWIVSGQKVWTSGAGDADFCFCFVRTDPQAPKHRGLSVLIIDMRSPGITLRPLPEITNRDHADFCEVFFDGVEVPAENLVGEPGSGWTISAGSLAHERGMLWTEVSSRLDIAFARLCALAAEPGPNGVARGADARTRDQLAGLYVDSQALKLMGYRGFAKFARGEVSPEHSLLKLLGSEIEQRLCLVGTETAGAAALDIQYDGIAMDVTSRDVPWALQYLRSFANTIAGGTSEIQRNIIAQRVLGLPRR